MATRPCPASAVVLEPAHATPVLERPAAACPTSASGGIEIAPRRASQGRMEAPSTRPSGSRSTSAPRGRVTTKTSSPGFVTSRCWRHGRRVVSRRTAGLRLGVDRRWGRERAREGLEGGGRIERARRYRERTAAAPNGKAR